MKVCYFGIYDPDFSTNRIRIKGLSALGHEVIQCRDSSGGLKKYWSLWKKHRDLNSKYDFLVVGYHGHAIVPFAKILSRKPVVADLFGSFEDAEKYSHYSGKLRQFRNRIIDYLAVRFADIVLLDSLAQKKIFEERFGHSEKYKVMYIGADEGTFYLSNDPKNSFKVLFRGRLTPESGVGYILEAADRLRDELIQFIILGRGYLLEKTKTIIADKKLGNVRLVSEHLSDSELRNEMGQCSLSLGQFENNPRLFSDIPHKAFESMAMGIPYLTADVPPIHEIIEEGKTGFLCPIADSDALAKRIKELSMQPELLSQVAKNSRALFVEQFSSIKLAQKLIEYVQKKQV